ncbi:P-type conjugative transfer ATPase TrbB (plasmid) [Rhizorhabdus wittichii DC-6]|uniref:P-type conjugative transfer ATPase TrbB n=1 Tax=Novosphingobium sp. KN65.2 TaxID=1478134 RepID=UPI0004AB49A7|nr:MULTISPECIES: P-type conjugative transfer ATPase TrbB [Sphingomonadaceae]ARR57690.1 P-type conjugative transfer ATPase TrbB [Rhizorhabdus wittichii DC-6]CDO34538.1 putative conjugal transfer protein trbB [Novosphingobium sp. KN65.2]
MVQHNPLTLDRKAHALRQSLGPVIASALAEKLVVEVMVNPDGKIWVDRIGAGREYSGHDMTPADAERILRLLADHAGEVVTRDRPRVSATLPETGERFQGIFPPVAANAMFSIRKRPEVIFTIDDYISEGIMSAAQAALLSEAAEQRANMLIVGGTGSGKTTLANAILALPAFAEDRVFLIEDTAELQCAATDKVELLTKRSDPPVTMTDLVRDSLRLRPDRIIIGEVRDGSALDLLKAWNTGHPGGLATIHANSAYEGLTRLEDLIGEVTQRIPYRAIAQAINVLVFIRRTKEGRQIENIARVAGRDGDRYTIEDIN